MIPVALFKSCTPDPPFLILIEPSHFPPLAKTDNQQSLADFRLSEGGPEIRAVSRKEMTSTITRQRFCRKLSS